MSDRTQFFHQALLCKCPRCHAGDLYRPGFLNLALNDRCAACGLDLARNDSADGPAVFLIFLLGAVAVPLALLLESAAHPPLWVHGVVWSVVILGATVLLLRPLKSLVIALQYRHRPGDWQ